MAINIDMEILKQIFKEQEEAEQAREKTKAEVDNIKAERLKLDQRKQRHKEWHDRERLQLLQEREQRARAKEQQQTEQVNKDNKIYIFSLLMTFGSILASVILLLVVILKY